MCCILKQPTTIIVSPNTFTIRLFIRMFMDLLGKMDKNIPRLFLPLSNC